MNIVVLDSYTVNPGDLSWDALKSLGECRLYDRTPKELIVERLREADVALTNKALIDGVAMAKLPRLRYIGVVATGYNCVDIPAAKSRNIVVTNVPTYGTYSVAQATFALLLELTNAVGVHAQTVRDGQWSKSPDFCYWVSPQIELAGLTLGLIGYGRIAQAVAKIGQALGMNVIVHTRTKPADTSVRHASLDEIFSASDVLSLHCPLTPDTKALVNAARLARMKRSAFMLNTSRGAQIDEPALADALARGVIAGAGLDVVSVEPADPANPLLTAKNCIVTPHIAWATRAARKRLLDASIDNVKAFLAGAPTNVIQS
jgi:glycerate dehydrogenase